MTVDPLEARQKGDHESDAVRDHREQSILMRAELSALVAVLVRNGAEKRFAGIKETEQGAEYTQEATETMRGWRP